MRSTQPKSESRLVDSRLSILGKFDKIESSPLGASGNIVPHDSYTKKAKYQKRIVQKLIRFSFYFWIHSTKKDSKNTPKKRVNMLKNTI